MRILLAIFVTLIAATAAAAAVVHSGGLLNFAADEPHPAAVEGLIAFARERFIDGRSRDFEVPRLDDPQRIAGGAAHYVPMCAGCHLGPGVDDTELRRGLYPQPPNLARPEGHGGHDHGDATAAARRQFWIIKHGIKMTAMPAWGATHDDDAIWDLVAFVQQLPEMSPQDYARTAQRAMDGQTASGHVDAPGAPPHEHGPASLPKPIDPKEDAHDHQH